MPMKQIKISEKVYDELKSLMLDRETFNIAIQRLINDNKSLKEDKIMLMKIAMQTDDSIAFPSINHSSFFAIMQTLKETSYSKYEKLGYLKIYLRKDLDIDYNAVLEVIKDIKDNYQIGQNKEEINVNNNILDKLMLWIEENYQS